MGYEEMTSEELEKANQELMAQVADIKAEQRKINAILDIRAMEAKTRQRLSGMSEAEQESMKRLLVGGIGGIESREAVGEQS